MALFTVLTDNDVSPVILVDRGIEESLSDLYATKIASDFIWEGEAVAKLVEEWLGGKGTVVELEGTVGASAANDRKEGFDNYINDGTDIEILTSQTGRDLQF